MPGPPWGEDSAADERVIAGNVRALLMELAEEAGQTGSGTGKTRMQPTIDLARYWHQRIYAGVPSVPQQRYLGAFRGSADELVGYEVALVDSAGKVRASGAPSDEVAEQLAEFQRAFSKGVAILDSVIPAGSEPSSADELHAVVRLAASVHGEWLRIHPFANGNGRTARTWANWIAMRYGLPPFVRIKPRPDGLFYADAAHESMGPDSRDPNHEPTFQLFLEMLRSKP